MKYAYYVQLEDKNIEEDANLGTLAGLKKNFSGELTTLVLTNHAKDLKEKFAKTGVKTIIYENKDFNLSDSTETAEVLAKVLSDKKDSLIVFNDSNLGNGLAARVAAKLNVTLVQHVDEILEGPNSITTSRKIGETTALRETVLKETAVITTSFNGIFEEGTKAKVEIKNVEFNSKLSGTYTKDTNSGNDLAYAKVVVSGGMGMKDKANFKTLKELADKLGGEVAATKAVTDKGWVDAKRMIGISNLTVKPDVYYAFGISGAVQHTAGMDKSKHIIAVNTDKSASIFKLANYGIIGDATKVIDQLINLL